MPIRLVIVEDSKVWKQHVQRLGKTQEIQLLAHYSNGEAFLKNARRFHKKAAIILMDIGLPGINGIECIARFKNKFPESTALFLIWTVHDDHDFFSDAFRAGAAGYILKSCSVREIVGSLQKCLHGDAPMSPAIARRVTSYFYQNRRLLPNETRLSKKQKEVLDLLEEQGLQYKQGAAALHISLNSFRTHLKRAYKKLDTHSLKEILVKRKKASINKVIY